MSQQPIYIYILFYSFLFYSFHWPEPNKQYIFFSFFLSLFSFCLFYSFHWPKPINLFFLSLSLFFSILFIGPSQTTIFFFSFLFYSFLLLFFFYTQTSILYLTKPRVPNHILPKLNSYSSQKKFMHWPRAIPPKCIITNKMSVRENPYRSSTDRMQSTIQERHPQTTAFIKIKADLLLFKTD